MRNRGGVCGGFFWGVVFGWGLVVVGVFWVFCGGGFCGGESRKKAAEHSGGKQHGLRETGTRLSIKTKKTKKKNKTTKNIRDKKRKKTS